MNKTNNKVEIKKFLGMEDVRIINEEYIVLKDMFNALGRVKEDGTWTNENNKLKEFIELINRESDHQSLVVSLKGKKQSKEEIKVECLKLDAVPIVLTQFKPTARKGEEALDKWKQFMMFVDDLLSSLEVFRYIVVDKDKYKTHIENIIDNGGSAVITNQQVNIIMAKLVGVYDKGIKSLKKEELKIYQNQTTIDLLEVREFVLDKFNNAFEFTGSHKTSAEMALKLAKKKFNIEEEINEKSV